MEEKEIYEELEKDKVEWAYRTIAEFIVRSARIDEVDTERFIKAFGDYLYERDKAILFSKKPEKTDTSGI